MFNLTHRNRYIYPVDGFGGLVDIQSEYEVEAAGGAGDSDKIATAMAAAASGNLTLYFGDGTYLISSKMVAADCAVICSPYATFIPSAVDVDILELRPNSYWRGGYFNTTGLDYAGTVINIDGQFMPGIAKTLKAPRLSGIDIYSKNTVPGGAGTGILLYSEDSVVGNKITFAKISGVRLNGLNIPIKLYCADKGYVNGNFFSDIQIAACGYGIVIEAAAGSTYNCAGNLFHNIYFQPTPSNPATVDCVTITGCDDNCFSNIRIVDAGNVSGYGINVVSGDGNRFEGPGLSASVYDGGSNTVIAGVHNKSWSGADLTSEHEYRLSPGTVSNGSQWQSDALPFYGATLGDFILVGCAQDISACIVCGYVTANNYVKIFIVNRSGGDVSITANTVFSVRRIPKHRQSDHLAWDPANLADGVLEAKEVTVSGAALGDFVLVSHDKDLTGAFICGQVTGANTVTAVIQNFSGGDLNIASGNVRVKLIPWSRANQYQTFDPASHATGAGETVSAVVFGAELGDYGLAAAGVDVADILVSTVVIDGYIKTRVQNQTTTNPNDLASSTWRFALLKRNEADVL